ncbi:MAG: hypothetical protein FWG40_12490 [Peptococcaceae bacterium]|nr:hypothetical protein [Peptococcaceae bacterium]
MIPGGKLVGKAGKMVAKGIKVAQHGRGMTDGLTALKDGDYQGAAMAFGSMALGGKKMGRGGGSSSSRSGFAQGSGGQTNKVHSKYPDGTVVLEGQQPQKITGPAKNADGSMVSGPHTVLQYDNYNGRVYKAREYGNNGIPIKDIDFTHPTFPNGTLRPNHTVPEQHLYRPNDPLNPKAGYKRGPGQPF